METAQLRGELVRYDSASHQFTPYLSGMSAMGVNFSRDGKWVTYVAYPEGTLWRSKVDGSERLQLTSRRFLSSSRAGLLTGPVSLSWHNNPLSLGVST